MRHQKKMIITGAAGFMGSEFLSQTLQSEEFSIVVVDALSYSGNLGNIASYMGQITFYEADISNKQDMENIFKKHHFDLVVNFAAESHVDRSIVNPMPFVNSNSVGVVTLLELSTKYGVDLFFQISTDEVYGSIQNGLASEESPILPSSPYSASKAAAENFIFGHHKTFGLNYLIVRSCNNYGIRQYPEKLIPFFINRIYQGMDLPLYGNGQNIREWINVRDFAAACLKLISLGTRNTIYNVSSGDFKTNEQIALLLCELMQYPTRNIAFVADRPGHDFRYALDSSKIRDTISWVPEVEFITGLTETIDWYKN